MRRGLWAGLVALGLLTACSSGGSAAKATTTSSTTTSTTAPTTSTTSPEDAVKAAYLAYWAMVDRVLEAPNPNDPEISQRAVDPLLASLKEQLSTKAAQGRHISTPDGHANAHRLDTVIVSGASATLRDCFVDGRVEFGPSGEVVDGETVTKAADVTLGLSGVDWRVSDIRFGERSPGVSECAA